MTFNLATLGHPFVNHIDTGALVRPLPNTVQIIPVIFFANPHCTQTLHWRLFALMVVVFNRPSLLPLRDPQTFLFGFVLQFSFGLIDVSELPNGFGWGWPLDRTDTQVEKLQFGVSTPYNKVFTLDFFVFCTTPANNLIISSTDFPLRNIICIVFQSSALLAAASNKT